MESTTTQSPKSTDSGSKPPGESQRGFRYYSNVIVDKFEWLFVGFIYLCGWSAILFVLAIFAFVFVEGAPAIFGNTDKITTNTQKAVKEISEQHGFDVSDSQLDQISAVVLKQLDPDKYHTANDDHPKEVFVTDVDGLTAIQKQWISDRLTSDLRIGRIKPFKLNPTDFASNEKWVPESAKKPQFGIFAMLMGTLSVTILSMLIAVPLGLGAAVYVSEFAGGKTRETLKVLIELLAAIPSVVWGFVGYMILGPILLDSFDSAVVGINLLNGGIILALMSVPVIVSMSEDALRAVPDSYREAAMALGANRIEMVFKVLFPAAKHGLLAAVLLGVGRAIGETMAVLMCTGHAVQIPEGLLDPVRTLTATIAAELGEAPSGEEHYLVLFVIGIVLFTFAFLINIIADVIVKGIRTEQHG